MDAIARIGMGIWVWVGWGFLGKVRVTLDGEIRGGAEGSGGRDAVHNYRLGFGWF